MIKNSSFLVFSVLLWLTACTAATPVPTVSVTATSTLEQVVTPTPTITITPSPTPKALATPSLTAIQTVSPTPSATATPARPDYHIEDTTNYMLYNNWLWHPDNLLATERLPIKNGRWSSDGNQLLGSLGQDVAILTLETGEVTLLENMPSNLYGLPSWSPDDRYLAYILHDMGSNLYELAIYDLNAEQETILPTPLSLVNNMNDINSIPGFSYDSSKIAYVRWEQETDESEYTSIIEVVDIATMEVSQLSGPPSIGFAKAIWSPVSDQLLIGAIPADDAFSMLGPEIFVHDEIYLADIENNTIEQLKGVNTHITVEDTGQSVGMYWGYYIGSPWSNDGKSVIYSDAGLICSQNILSREETCMRELMNDIHEIGAFGAKYPNWSPTGEWISFVLQYPSEFCNPVAVIKPDGTDLRYTNAELDDCAAYSPSWSPRK